ncbi:MAG: DNA repair protein [Candidatus Fluviicola riflensis]|nr:MAG: DNA repair protein [Candidatus Fluviicola riflensis]OGS78562.1 MAG: DNA repair protein [Candidatus Fluviicola riflensis]OGS85616.1 MAG: DNA repair protein [Fluviicola sp. RIFCSPHIGHO2_01_FULL_43_53]OGS89540.1 MAG: DNA repair protein [Fluviicola sp. RIFCSPHIGHO2_12_FULL_43_24]
MNVKLTQEQKIQVLNSQDLYAIMQKVLLRENKIRRNQEHFWVIGLDTNNKILFIELISLGAVNRVQVNAPEVFRMAIYKTAVKIILVHNHPSGDTIPSQPDLDMTNLMLKAGEIIQIKIVDHLIITEETYISFEDLGYMQQLRNNDTYRIVGEHEAELKAMMVEIEKLKVKHEMAKVLLKEGDSIEKIMRVTGLTKEEIERLLKKK